MPYETTGEQTAAEWTRRDVVRAALIGVAATATALRPDPAAARRLPEGRIWLCNLQTDERLAITYRTESGAYDQDALEALNHLLRCHHTNESTMMDVRLIEFANVVQRKLGRRELHVVSGYRSPEYNAQLIRMGTRAARHSYHVSGQAMDIQIPGVPLRMIREIALRLGGGGVGYYPRGKFVHLDSGPVRYW